MSLHTSIHSQVMVMMMVNPSTTMASSLYIKMCIMKILHQEQQHCQCSFVQPICHWIHVSRLLHHHCSCYLLLLSFVAVHVRCCTWLHAAAASRKVSIASTRTTSLKLCIRLFYVCARFVVCLYEWLSHSFTQCVTLHSLSFPPLPPGTCSGCAYGWKMKDERWYLVSFIYKVGDMMLLGGDKIRETWERERKKWYKVLLDVNFFFYVIGVMWSRDVREAEQDLQYDSIWPM